MSKIERQRQHFESISHKYYTERKNSNHLLLKKLMWDDFFAGKNIFFEGMRVLEPMCGFGEGKKIIEQYCPVDFFYEGFDYSRTLVDLARKDDPDLNIQWGDITRYQGNEDSPGFDLIILIGGLHHVYRDVDLALKNISAVLKPGGHFINFEPTQNFPPLKMVRAFLYKHNNLFDEDTEQGFDLSHLNRLFRDNGYAAIDQRYPGLLSYILYYNPDAFPLLNRGGKRTVTTLYRLDKPFMRNLIGRTFSFATLSLFRKQT